MKFFIMQHHLQGGASDQSATPAINKNSPLRVKKLKDKNKAEVQAQPFSLLCFARLSQVSPYPFPSPSKTFSGISLSPFSHHFRFAREISSFHLTTHFSIASIPRNSIIPKFKLNLSSLQHTISAFYKIFSLSHPFVRAVRSPLTLVSALNYSYKSYKPLPMASINFNPFESWFNKPPRPLPPINLLSLTQSVFLRTQTPSKFASISTSDLFKGPKQPENKKSDQPESEPERGAYSKMLAQFYWECENLPDYRDTLEVEKILNEDPVFGKKENPTEEEIREIEEFWEEFRANPVVQFLAQAELIADTVK
ncbi:hypothetical protein FEM48_Zijuj11G0116100 [Ziziphus jujuba var. spinosa]|uniref:Uncharacterized protein n=1 Tax=Ziziphus jujuba var. spinosa TaxID=714518 RepID=A0A978UIQ4_ZIZJJ|nr:hypothetical protein FEM48_Zijuj11G0116100 [Ziziphus jujuba var. spinosa]